MRFAGFWLVAGAMGLAVACGDLLSQTSPDPGDDGGAPDGTIADVPDAAVFDAPVPSCSERFDAALVLCDDFERDEPSAPAWLSVFTAENGAVTVSGLHARSGSRSLLTEVPDATANGNMKAQLLSRDFDAGTFPMILEFDMLAESVPAFADAPYNGFLFGSYGGDDELVFSSGVSAVGAYNPYLLSVDAPVEVPLGQWLHFVITVDNAKTVMAFEPVTGGKNVTRERIFALATPPRKITIGVDVGASGGPVRLFFDDVIVHH